MVGINSQGPNFQQPNLGNKKQEQPKAAENKAETTQNTVAQPSITASAIDLMGYANQALINRPTTALSKTAEKALAVFDQVHQTILSEFQHVAGIEDKAPALALAVLERHYQ